jgi:hypothetical protein
MPGWPVFVFISGEGHFYHKSTFCPALMRGQRKAEARGHLVRPMRAISVREAEEIGRRPCARCIPSRTPPRNKDATH